MNPILFGFLLGILIVVGVFVCYLVVYASIPRFRAAVDNREAIRRARPFLSLRLQGPILWAVIAAAVVLVGAPLLYAILHAIFD
jgi:hypothetical protein